MSSTQKNFALPLAFIGIMFFAIGFALGINSVLIPVLQGSLGITSAESYLISLPLSYLSSSSAIRLR